MGDTLKALDELQRAKELRALDMVWVRSRHTFDALRGEPDFRRSSDRLKSACKADPTFERSAGFGFEQGLRLDGSNGRGRDGSGSGSEPEAV